MPRSPWVTRPRGSIAQFSVEDDAELAQCELAEMHDVVVVHQPVRGPVLHHRRDHRRLGAVTPRMANGVNRSGFDKVRNSPLVRNGRT
jgi:hypothetical protein